MLICEDNFNGTDILGNISNFSQFTDNEDFFITPRKIPLVRKEDIFSKIM